VRSAESVSIRFAPSAVTVICVGSSSDRAFP
jgi:hypothetical protein